MINQPCLFCKNHNSDPNSQTELDCCNSVTCKKCLKDFIQYKISEGCTELECPNTNCLRKKSASSLEILCDNAPKSIPVQNSCPFCWADYPEEKSPQVTIKCQGCGKISCKLCHEGEHKGSCFPRKKVF